MANAHLLEHLFEPCAPLLDGLDVTLWRASALGHLDICAFQLVLLTMGTFCFVSGQTRWEDLSGDVLLELRLFIGPSHLIFLLNIVSCAQANPLKSVSPSTDVAGPLKVVNYDLHGRVKMTHHDLSPLHVLILAPFSRTRICATTSLILCTTPARSFLVVTVLIVMAVMVLHGRHGEIVRTPVRERMLTASRRMIAGERHAGLVVQTGPPLIRCSEGLSKMWGSQVPTGRSIVEKRDAQALSELGNVQRR